MRLATLSDRENFNHMRWRNTETPTFSGSDGRADGSPDVAETFEAIDRDGNVAVAIIKAVDGTISMEIDGEAVPSLDAVTSTELGYLDGVTSSIQTQLNSITNNGLVSSAEFLFVNGVTSAIQTQLDAITTPSGAGAAAGTGNVATEGSMATAHKTTLTLTNVAVTMTDEAGQIAWGGLKLYDFPAGVIDLSALANLAVTSTSTQIETATVTAAAGCTADGDLIVTITGSGLAGSPLDVTVPLTTAENTASLVAAEIRAALNATAAITALYTVGGATDKVLLTKALTASGPDATLNIDINADHGSTTATGITNEATSTDTTTGIIAAYDGDFSVGTVIAANDNALTSTEADIIASTAMPQAVAGATTAKGYSAASVRLDGTTTPKDLYLNFLIDDADQDIDASSATLVANGTIVIHWTNLGDY